MKNMYEFSDLMLLIGLNPGFDVGNKPMLTGNVNSKQKKNQYDFS